MKIGYCYSEEYCKVMSLLPIHPKREDMTFRLLSKCKNFTQNCKVIEPKIANVKHLAQFHSKEYLHALGNNANCKETLNAYGLVDDAYVFDGLEEYCRVMAGASLTMAKLVGDKKLDVGIHWGGGRHHASYEKASGFCYVNDVVLSILELIQLGKVLCIDMDIHHGDGTESAFYHCGNVFTLSFHKLGIGFFPGTGQQKSIGNGYGRHTNINVPLRDGTNDEEFKYVFQAIVEKVVSVFDPNAIVVVCGVDTLGSDPLGTFNVTPSGIGECLLTVQNYKLPMLVLGGGGYHKVDAPKCFATLTSMLLDMHLPEDIPEHEYFEMYGPNFSMKMNEVHCRPSQNTKESLQSVIDRAHRQVNRYKASIQ